MTSRLLPLAALAAAALALPAGASAARYEPGQVIVHYRDGTSAVQRSAVRRGAELTGGAVVPGGGQQAVIRDGSSVQATIAELRRDPRVLSATPNYIARAAALVPNDPGFRLQWNLSGPFSINMPEAWSLARGLKAPGGRGATVAVLDTGVAYRTYRRFRRTPDLDSYVAGYDFVDGDPYPLDENGHGTFVAGTIAESTNNGMAAAGIAYHANIMPVRVLDADGAGDTISIARGIRFAARRRVNVINLSLEFDSSVRASQIPDIVSALRYARKRGVLVVAAAGNSSASQVAYPARAKDVLAVAATTVRGCQAEYSNSGSGVDLAAPGGGADAANTDTAYDLRVCRPEASGRFVYQQTFTNSVRSFGLPGGYEGTSMAAPHVSGVAALLYAAMGKRRRPSVRTVQNRLELTARDIGAPGPDLRYGYGLLDAAAALRGATASR